MGTLRGAISMAWISIHTTLWCVPLYLMGCVRLAMPNGKARIGIGSLMDRIIDGWVASNRLLVWALRLSVIDARFGDAGGLRRDGWYLVVSNHQSWVDIIVLQNTLLGRIPPLKFFTKRELIWVPLVGVAMWFLGFPYVRRYGRERLAQNPELAEHDRNATLKASQGFAERPTSVLSFLEGTRFTEAKHAAQSSPYRHLLRPKAGGLSYVATALGGGAPNHLGGAQHKQGGGGGVLGFQFGPGRP
ncbi:MAG: acetyltransferase, partial [Gammaproteobacteria bacterium]|nr:acetyltransferase [Gammaproteobacteria bacterium]